MFKHIEDDAGVSLLVNDSGAVLLVCANGHQWVGSMQPAEDAEAASKSELAVALQRHAIRDVPGLDMEMLERPGPEA